MKICMMAYTFYEGDNRVRRYAETLVRRGDRVDAIVLRRSGQPRSAVIQGVQVLRMQERQKNESGPLTYLVRLVKFFLVTAWVLTLRHLREPYDVVHVHSIPDFQVFATLIPRLLGARVILDIHDIVPEMYASKFRISPDSFAFRLLVLVERLSVRYSHHVIIANHIWHKRLIERSCPADHCTTILNYPDPAIFYPRPRPASTENEFVLFYPGSLSWHQGVDLIISALARLREQAPHIRLLIAGEGAEQDRLVALAKENNLSERVTVRSPVPLDQVAQIMASADLGVEPKRKHSFANEALSTKIPEFMAVGIPVLASDTRVHQLYFGNGTVQFFASDDVEELAAAILALSRDPDRRNALRERGLDFVRENNWDVKKHQYLDLVDRLAGRRCRRAGKAASASRGGHALAAHAAAVPDETLDSLAGSRER